MSNIHGTYFIFHPEGYYWSEKEQQYYDRVQALETLKDTMKYVNRCRRNCSPRKPPIKPKLILLLECGQVTKRINL